MTLLRPNARTPSTAARLTSWLNGGQVGECPWYRDPIDLNGCHHPAVETWACIAPPVTPLMMWIRSRPGATVITGGLDWFLARGARLEAGDGHARTALHHAADTLTVRRPETLDMVRALLARGAAVDAVSITGETPLMLAAGRPYAAALEVFLQAGANPARRRGDGSDVLGCACDPMPASPENDDESWTARVAILLRHGVPWSVADVPRHHNALVRAAWSHDAERVRALLELGALRDPGDAQRTWAAALTVAVSTRTYEGTAATDPRLAARYLLPPPHAVANPEAGLAAALDEALAADNPVDARRLIQAGAHLDVAARPSPLRRALGRETQRLAMELWPPEHPWPEDFLADLVIGGKVFPLLDAVSADVRRKACWPGLTPWLRYLPRTATIIQAHRSGRRWRRSVS